MKKKKCDTKIFRSIGAVALSCAVFAGTIPSAGGVSHAAKKPLKSAEQEIIEQSKLDDDTFAPEKGHPLLADQALPSSLDLRSRNIITPVRQQSPFGTCWGFGSIAAAESSILSAGLANDPKSLNLSEKQLAWFVNNPLQDEDNSQNGEGITYPTDYPPLKKIDSGGLTIYCTSMFASGVGPVSEYTNTEDGDIFSYRGKNHKLVNKSVSWYDESGNEQSGYKRVYYSPNDDWTIPEKYRSKKDYSLSESYLLPDAQTEDGQTAIKDQLNKGHAVAVSFYADTSSPFEVGEDLTHYISEHWAHYTFDHAPDEANHVVTIVGYDDKYPASNFVPGHQPEGDGAWLVKNSWGSDLNDFPDNGYSNWGLLEGEDTVGVEGTGKATSKKHTGYFWLSYHDKSIGNAESYSFEKANQDEKIIQYDYCPVTSYKAYSADAEMKMANMFESKENSKIDAVSLFTATPGSKARFSIRLLHDEAQSLEEGVVVYTSPFKEYKYGGYHREAIPEGQNIYLATDQHYVIEVEEKTPSGRSSISFGAAPADEDCGDGKHNTIVNQYESFVYIAGMGWGDLSNKNVQKLLLNNNSGKLDNFPIKAYLSPVDNDGAYIFVNNQYAWGEGKWPLNIGSKVQAEAYVYGANKEVSPPSIKWSSSDTNIFTTLPSSANNSTAYIICNNPGQAYLTCDAGIYGKKVMLIKVNELHLAYFALEGGYSAETQVYTGKEIKPELSVWFSSADPETNEQGVEGRDYELKWKNNTKCGLASVTLTGKGRFENIHEQTLFFNIVPKKAKITNVKAGSGKMTVSFASQKASGISGYRITYQESGSSKSMTMIIKDPAATSAVISGLTPNKTYKVFVEAYINCKVDTGEFDENDNPILGDDTLCGDASDTKTSGKIKTAVSSVKVTKTISASKVKKSAQTAIVIDTPAAKKNINVSGSKTKKSLQKYIKISSDKKTVTLKKGAKKGKYKITISVSGGSSATYTNLSKKTYTVTVK